MSRSGANYNDADGQQEVLLAQEIYGSESGYSPRGGAGGRGGKATASSSSAVSKPPDVPETREFGVRDVTNDRHNFCDNGVTTSKYSFIPIHYNFVLWKNLFEQFHKAANIYFLLISALQLIPGLSPTGRYTTLGPLVVVLLVTMVKDIYEDFKRHRSDAELNRKPATIWGENSWTTVAWRDIKVGDLCMVRQGEPFPADLILVYSTNPEGIGYIETASLDGETNLKVRKAPQTICRLYSPQSPDTVLGRVVCELPNNRLYNFDGYFEMSDEVKTKVALVPDNILLRGAILRNTQEAVGIVVFTGQDTKLMKNSSAKASKLSRIDHVTNKQVLIMFIAEVLLAIGCTGGAIAALANEDKHWYLPKGVDSSTNSTFIQILTSLGTFVILFNNLIPISLYVTMEMVKLTQVYFINNDVAMYHADSNTAAMARTSSLNEELGQVEYIFSDKTGTLTCNMMDFSKFTCTMWNDEQRRYAMRSYGTGTTEIGAQKIVRERREQYQQALAANGGVPLKNAMLDVDPITEGKPLGWEPKNGFYFYDRQISDMAWFRQGTRDSKESLRFFFSFLAVCHAVIPEHDPQTGELIYQAASPDEGCLVKAAREIGVVFKARTDSAVIIEVNGVEESWLIYNVIEFDSTRKRMSVICEDPQGRILLLCKGADTVIYDRLRKSQETAMLHQETLSQITAFAAEGLRTLVLGKAVLDPAAYDEWNQEYTTASLAIHNRAAKMAAVAELIERDLELVGTTAIEDKLQQGVPDTIDLLSRAGIKIWVLTGDKQETAINIGFACSLLHDDMGLFVFTGCDDTNITSILKCYLSDAKAVTKQDMGLVVEGHMLELIVKSEEELDAIDSQVIKDQLHERENLFLALASRCRAVICCRVSPLQKAAVVSLVKKNLDTVTLAIGDGANDVSMIQAAHVGVGISGLEGLQAARASDYSIAQFRYLKRLLLVHGRYNYRRVSKVILYCFYKNICLYFTQFWFTLFNNFTGQSLYDQWALSLYNVVFSTFPIIVLGALDRDVAMHRLLDKDQFPELYSDGLTNRLFNTATFWKFSLNATVHSVIAFMLPIYILQHLTNEDGQAMGLTVTGLTTYTIVLWVISMKVGFETQSWTVVNVIITAASLIAWYVFLLLYGIMFKTITVNDLAFWYNTPMQGLGHPTHWLCVIIVAALPALRELVWKTWRHNYSQTLMHEVQQLEARGKPFGRSDANPRLISHGGHSLRYFAPQDRSAAGQMAFLDWDFTAIPKKVMKQVEAVFQTNSTRDLFAAEKDGGGDKRKSRGNGFIRSAASTGYGGGGQMAASFISRSGHTKIQDIVVDELL